MISINVKQKFSKYDVLGMNRFSFLNLTSITELFKNRPNDKTMFYIDGILLVWLLRFVYGVRVERCSFDMGSIAVQVFDICHNDGISICFIGASESEIEIFTKKIRLSYPKLNIVMSRSGYVLEEEFNDVARDIVQCGSQVVVIGMGAGLQERMQNSLYEMGYTGSSFTCGGFIRQESKSTVNYYPRFVNKFNLRAFYRMYMEPHTRKRYLYDYPKNIIKLCVMRLRRNFVVEVVS
jgi:exopolysaccharide biosynthesis WecB/TagA/CpsF family protein